MIIAPTRATVNPNANNSSSVPSGAEHETASTIRFCKTCKHFRSRSNTQLFSSTELQTAGGMKAYSEWQQQEKQHAEREAQLVSAGAPFTYEPHHYAWCAAFTLLELASSADAGDESALAELMRVGGASVNPVTGKVTPIYALCLRRNPRGDCEKYESR